MALALGGEDGFGFFAMVEGGRGGGGGGRHHEVSAVRGGAVMWWGVVIWWLGLNFELRLTLVVGCDGGELLPLTRLNPSNARCICR